MRKKLITEGKETASVEERHWLDMNLLAEAELSSEDPEHPFELSFLPGTGRVWRATEPGQQTIRVNFDEAQSVRHIRLVFSEEERKRTQQFALEWSADGGRSFKEIVRQQYNFSPPDMTIEREEYEVSLQGLTNLQLTVVPDISGGEARASLAEFRVAGS